MIFNLLNVSLYVLGASLIILALYLYASSPIESYLNDQSDKD